MLDRAILRGLGEKAVLWERDIIRGLKECGRETVLDPVGAGNLRYLRPLDSTDVSGVSSLLLLRVARIICH